MCRHFNPYLVAPVAAASAQASVATGAWARWPDLTDPREGQVLVEIATRESHPLRVVWWDSRELTH